MEKTLYPLNVGQMLQYLPIRETGTQRCCNISVFSGLQTEIDFDLLKRCIKDEYRRYECLRLRFTAPDEDGYVMQYIADRDDRDIPHLKNSMSLRSPWSKSPWSGCRRDTTVCISILITALWILRDSS